MRLSWNTPVYSRQKTLLLACISFLILFNLSAISAFRFAFFSSTDDVKLADEHENVYRHPRSPAEIDPKSAVFRAKRQAYKISEGGGSMSISTDNANIAESGNWGEWKNVRECSRSCGGGVLVEERQCNGECTGPTVRYVSCNLDPCSTKTDYRAEQCASHNDDALDGNYFKWIPYPGKNKCELTCKPDTANFYYKWADKVVDGTSCGDDAVCVDGVCLPLGCDGRLGSEAKKDNCGVCNGNGTTCKSVDGIFDERNLKAGYHDVVVLPIGATGIKIHELRPTTNSLAIKNASGHFYLNGNYQIHLLDKDVITAGGASFQYSKPQPNGETEKLSAVGPLDEELTIALLFQPTGNSKPSAVKYEYSMPLEDDLAYYYKPGEWSSCSVTCGKGVRKRTPYCIDALTQARVDDQQCDENNATKPEFEKPCETVHCDSEWFTGDWEECSENCGDKGWQYRTVYCNKVFSDGRRITVPDSNCSETSERPTVKQSCNRFSCPEWHAGPWSACSEKCGDAKQYRSVTCRSEKEGEEGKLLPANHCPEDMTNLESERNCNLGPCEGLYFHTSEWNLCQRCNDTEETRNVTCKDQSGRVFPPEKCLNDTINEIPIDTRSCATQAPCIYEWHTSQWSNCSTECGHGHKSRKVHCAINELGTIQIVEESQCAADEKPSDREECVNEAKCTGTYFSGPWTNCSKECGGGSHSRVVVCLNYDRKPVPEWCDESVKPSENENCNVDPCPTCGDSEFGCCPDNSTFAKGPSLEGCSNCSVSEFGCCADNYTTATGPNAEGCLEYEAPVEGSGEEETDAAKEVLEGQKCEVTNEETGEKISVSCESTIPPPTGDEAMDLLMGNDTSTDGENATKHCSKSEFGCCPDWYTPAEGADNAGCPQTKLGSCNETKFGCCLDNVTLARGPDYQGCGEPTCAASLYGCCKDRKTIAFGPHYAGCERSSFPCELSNYGCCPDGETAALDKNLTGCGASCLLTKFGCCPDMKTHAKGPNNEGCGCEFAQFGCCPDGKSPAQGPGFYGCPATCAQSQFGCCPDGKTAARGSNKEGCPCQYTRWGCCPDGETSALGPRNEGCDDCRYAKYGCCSDGVSKAYGPDYAGCPTTTPAPFIIGGTVAPQKIVSCNLPQDGGAVCGSGYRMRWFYNTAEGRCAQFWFGGCAGNENNYDSREQCEQICVDPPQLGRCYLPKVEGAKDCDQLVARYWYDYTTRQCAAFWYRGCLGNSNNFPSWEECQSFCSNVGPISIDSQPQQAPHSQTHQRGHTPYGPPSVAQQQQLQQQQQQQQQQQRPVAPPQQYPSYPQHFVTPATPQMVTPTVAQVPNVQQPPYQPYNVPAQPQSELAKSREICSLRLDIGRCEGHFDSWYYEVATGLCEQFQYSGCGGNANRFHTKEQCEGVCIRPVQPSTPAEYNGATRGALSAFAPSSGSSNSFDQPSIAIVGNVLNRQLLENNKRIDGASSVCEADKDSGSCSRFVAKWYYNKLDGTCNRFHYGGCDGNGNRFTDEQECKNTCGDHIDACQLPKVTGPCAGKLDRYYYDRASRQCQPFVFSGCLGNSNNFGTAQECAARCGASSALKSYAFNSARTQNLQDFDVSSENGYEANNHARMEVCRLPKDTGPCRATISMFYYNVQLGTCIEFEYGGCFGNENLFETKRECERKCSSTRRQSTEKRDEFVAKLPIFKRYPREPTPPVLVFPIENSSYYYTQPLPSDLLNKEDVVLSSRSYNNDRKASVYDNPAYETLNEIVEEDVQQDYNEIEDEEDMRTEFPENPDSLPDLCMLPVQRGSCYGEILRWRYDSEQRRCASFLYSGCDANANHFESVEACERACGAYRNQIVCRMRHDVGTCHLQKSSSSFEERRSTRWFYDAGLGKCNAFLWSGCSGNGNRFVTRAECEDLCTREMKSDGTTTTLRGKSNNDCQLERDSGPCSDQLTQWYYDVSVAACRPFTYGGCRGNANRFNSKALCQRRCETGAKFFEDQEGDESRDMTPKNVVQTYETLKGNEPQEENRPPTRLRARIEADQPSPYLAGKNIELRCIPDYGKILAPLSSRVRRLSSELEERKPIYSWYWNEAEMRRDEFADEFEAQRIKFEFGGRKLKILSVKASDAGIYSCIIGENGIISEPYTISVQEVPAHDDCADRGTLTTCAQVVRTGLCATARYGKFCCRSCTMKVGQ